MLLYSVLIGLFILTLLRLLWLQNGQGVYEECVIRKLTCNKKAQKIIVKLQQINDPFLTQTAHKIEHAQVLSGFQNTKTETETVIAIIDDLQALINGKVSA